jgi:spermidine synthase
MDAQMNRKKPIIDLLLISFLALYLELILIRWLASEIRVFAYFKNFPLMAAFLGLGIGCTVANRRKIVFFLLPVLLSGVCIVASFSSQLKLVHLFFPDPGLYQWRGSIISPNLIQFLETVPLINSLIGVIPDTLVIWFVAVLFFLIVIMLFGVSVAIFYPVGQKLGAAMTGLPPLTAYTVNIAGSLLGTLTFTGISLLRLPPWVWLLIALPVMLYFSPRKIWTAAFCIPTILLVFMMYASRQNVVWSPYYRISYTPGAAGSYDISVDHDYHQKILNLAPQAVAQYPDILGPSQRYYDLPYQLQPNPPRVLIIGAGTGNDAAAALRAGSRKVDAAEIDPVLVQLGQRFHAEKPYFSDRVNVVVNDARAYFHQQRGKSQYDLIVFGLVDSHTALSSVSSLRLEFYLYTKESIEEALSLLNPQNGVIVVNFSVGWKEWLGQRLYNTIQAAAGQAPLVLESVQSQYDSSVTYVCGPGLEQVKSRLATMLTTRDDLRMVNEKYGNSQVGICRDDWPFLYLNPHAFPIAYLIALVLMLASGWVMVRLCLKPSDTSTFRTGKMDWHTFFMGAAFLLIETKNIIQLSLLFGATWIVNAVVFISIFVMILIANLLVAKTRIGKVKPLFLCLIGALVLNYFVPFSALTLLSPLIRAFIGGLITALPVLFSAFIFAMTFSQSPNADVSLGSNILGALLGGALEALSLAIGIKSLSLLAVAVYLLAWYAFARQSHRRIAHG